MGHQRSETNGITLRERSDMTLLLLQKSGKGERKGTGVRLELNLCKRESHRPPRCAGEPLSEGPLAAALRSSADLLHRLCGGDDGDALILATQAVQMPVTRDYQTGDRHIRVKHEPYQLAIRLSFVARTACTGRLPKKQRASPKTSLRA